ncbi:MAG: SDR family oxidoreductase [Solirubrobacteraceae bacterium]
MAKQRRVLAGQTVAITGAARGIGRATAVALARAGMRVAIGDVDLDAARATAAEVGPTAVALELDVSSRDSFEAFLHGVEEQLGPLDVLVNNAGIMLLGRFVDEDDDATARMIDVNLHGVILGCKLALARMLPRNRGHIVNISSQAGKYGAPGGATYSASKHAVVGLSEAIRGELRLMRADVDVSYVMPFAVDTELGGSLGSAVGMRSLRPEEVADAIVEALRERIVEVWVPKSGRSTHVIGELLPRRAAEAVAHAIRADRVLAGADLSARRDYELRAAGQERVLERGASRTLAAGDGSEEAAEAAGDGSEEAAEAAGDGSEEAAEAAGGGSEAAADRSDARRTADDGETAGA